MAERGIRLNTFRYISERPARVRVYFTFALLVFVVGFLYFVSFKISILTGFYIFFEFAKKYAGGKLLGVYKK
ncbi:hypothetical protein J4423_03195 [Candidatus Pacearchaeota archaeon]|nr:hypothetical protein [Candidatus Pacearchaeota archaeon]